MTQIWSVMLWSRSYHLMEGSRMLGYIDVHMYLSANMVDDVVTLSALLSVHLPANHPTLRESVQTALLRYGTIQSHLNEDLIMIAVDQDPWRIQLAINSNLRDSTHALGLSLVNINRRHRDLTMMADVERFFQRAPHLMMLAQSQVIRDRACGSREIPFPWSMVLDDLNARSIQDLVTWIVESKEGRYDALLSAMAQGVTIQTAWDQARP